MFVQKIQTYSFQRMLQISGANCLQASMKCDMGLCSYERCCYVLCFCGWKTRFWSDYAKHKIQHQCYSRISYTCFVCSFSLKRAKFSLAAPLHSSRKVAAVFS